MSTWTGKLWGWLSLAAFLSFNAAATVLYVDLNCTNATPPYTDWSIAATNIQDAIDAAVAGDTVLVTNGVYATGGKAVYGTMTNRVAVDKPLTLLSVNGPKFTFILGFQVPGTTNGNGAIRCVYLTNSAVLSGFTLANGATRSSGDYFRDLRGGGVWCQFTNASVSNCWLTCNSAQLSGGGSYSGRILNSVISGNTSGIGGGVSDGIIYHCTIVGNSASAGGGAAQGPGSNLGPTLNNCTLVGNSAINGGGAYFATMNGCIVYYNMAGNGANFLQNQYGGFVNGCSTDPVPLYGLSNSTNAPLFVNTNNWSDLRLQSNSPCINAGINAYVAGATDLDGNPRIVGGTVDIGAYEFQSPASTLSYAWAQQYGLPTDGSADTADTDGDQVSNFAEWKSGTVPTNAVSVLKLVSPSNGVSGLVVMWQSVTNITYFLQRSSDLAGGFTSIVSNRVGQTGSTSYTDTTATNAGPYFYRVGVQ